MLIAFSGPQSSGKSTLLEQCRIVYRDKFEYVREIARSVHQQGGKINEDGDDIGQLLIVNRHLENSLKKNAVVDRCIIDALAYSIYSHERHKISHWVKNYCEDILNLILPKYSVIFYTDPGIPLRDDGFRSMNIHFRNEISNIFEGILADYFKSGKAVRLVGGVEERMSIVQREIEARSR